MINDAEVSSFTNVVYETRLGSNNQTTIPDFQDTWSDRSIGKKLIDATTWVQDSTVGDAVTSITIGLLFPQGIFYANDSGGMSDYSVKIAVEYKSHSSATWLQLPNSGHVMDTMYYYVDQTPTYDTNYSIARIPTADATGPYQVYKKQVTAKGDPVVPTYYVGDITTKPITAVGHVAYPPGSTTPNSGKSAPSHTANGTTTQYAWCEVKSDFTGDYFTFTDKRSSAIRKSFKVTGLAPDMYDIRVKYYVNPDLTSRYGSSCYFEYLQEAIPDDFTYPNTALLGMSILATDQLSGGLPKITCLASRITGTYGRLDNPAWAALDLLTNTRYGAGVSLDRVDLSKFTEWADYCTAQNFTINLYIDQQLTLVQGLQLIGQLGRGRVVQFGSDFSVLIDKPDILPTQGFLFTMGNIIQDSYSMDFIPLKDRANIIEITYYDIENDYLRTVLEVSQGNYDLNHQVNKTSIDLLGCVTREQALRQARFHLNQNRFITITSSFEVSIDSLYCKIGDIINVAHDVPQWGFSGRIISNTINTIVVDRDDLTILNTNPHWIQISDANTDEQVYVQVSSVVGNVVTTVTNLPILGEYSVYSFGEVNRHAKQMRIISISTAGDLKRKISAVEYVPEVYNDVVDTIQIANISYGQTLGITISEYLSIAKDGTIQPIVQLSWRGSALSYEVSYMQEGDSIFTSAGTARGNSMDIPGLTEGKTYTFMVDGIQNTYTVLGKTQAPDPVSNLVGTELGNTFTLSWSYPYKPLDFKEFIILDGTVQIGSTTTNSFTTDVIFGSTSKTLAVKAKDTTGNLSTTSSVTIPITPVPVVTAVSGSISKDMLNMSWTYTSKPNDFSHYIVRNSSGYVGTSTAESYSGIAPKHTPGVYTYSVTAIDTSGNESISTTCSITIATMTITGVTYTFKQNTIDLNWTTTNSNYLVNSFTTSESSNVYTSSISEVLFNCVWLGSRNVTIVAKDSAGNSTTIITPVNIDAPNQPVVNAIASATNGVEFSWTTTAGTCGIKEYLITYNGNIINTKDSFYFVPTITQGTYTIQVVAKDWADNQSTSGSKVISVISPSVSNIQGTTTNNTIELSWLGTKGTFNIKEYLVEYIDGIGVTISKRSTTSYISINPNWLGNKTFSITAIDIANNIGVTSQLVYTTSAPAQPNVTSNIVGKDIVLSIAESRGSFGLDKVEVFYDTTTVTIASGTPTWSLPIFWDLDKIFTITSIDVLGNRSTSRANIVSISECSVTNLYSNVVDNNVMLYWTGVTGSLPIEHFRILKGTTYLTAEEIGIRKGTFAAIFENKAGTYTYWIEPIDTAGNAGVYSSISSSVSQPPDFILNIAWTSDWSGTKTNTITTGNIGTLPIDRTETYSNHFSTRTWATIQDQVSAGYPLWLTPNITTATYSQTFDYGTVLGSTSITLTDPVVTQSGTGTYIMNRTISISSDGSTWTAQPLNSLQVFVTNIRYVKVDYSWTTSNKTTTLTVGTFSLRLDAKIKSDSGTKACLSTDSGGTVVPFNIPFVDITSISVTPQGTTPLIATYDFVDIPNPTSFKVLLYTTAGVRASGSVSWDVTGY
jgi:hypothetical protein